MHAVRKLTYGKHIIAHIEKLEALAAAGKMPRSGAGGSGKASYPSSLGLEPKASDTSSIRPQTLVAPVALVAPTGPAC